MQWVGWIFDTRRQRWCRVCAAEGLGQCSRDLGAIVRFRGTKDRYATMTGGAVPSFRPAGKMAAGAHRIAQDGIEEGKPSEAQ